MIKTFPIEFVRVALNFALHKNINETEYFDESEISLYSFYEHLVEEGEVDRYVERYKELVSQQNRENLIGFGIVATTDTPSITNLKTSFIVPFEWGCTIRCNLANRDTMLGTLYKLIVELKGKKVDVAQFDNGKVLAVGTLLNNGFYLQPYDFVGNLNGTDINTFVDNLLDTYDLTDNTEIGSVIYAESNNKLIGYIKTDDGFVADDTLVPVHESFEKYKIDLGFDDLKVNEPFTMNAEHYCEFVFGGTATFCKYNNIVGNDLVQFGIKKYKILGETDYVFSGDYTFLEPMEMPSGSSANSIPNQLRSNLLKANSHTDSVAITRQYTFLLDTEIELINEWFKYGRYGDNGLVNNTIAETSITPNIIYLVKEYISCWGKIEIYENKMKLVDEIAIENTESDIMTIQLNFQLQGDNN